MRYWLLITALILFAFLKNIPLALAESLSVSLRVGDTRISFDGYTSPSAFITITQNSTVVGTTVADLTGYFIKEIDAVNPGIQSFELYAEDTNSLLTPTISYNVNLTPNTLTSISNIVFPPTISLDSVTNIISGMTNPAATLTLLVSDSSSITIPVNVDGSWSRSMTDYDGGTYSAYAIATMPGNYMSLESKTVTFTIASSSITSPSPSSTPGGSTSLSPTPSSTPIVSPPSTSLTTSSVTPQPSPITKPGIFNVGNFVTIARPVSPICFILLLIIILLQLRIIYLYIQKRRREDKSKDR